MKIVTILILSVVSMLMVPLVTAENELGPELETYIHTGFNFFAFQIIVRNVGDEIAHNVTITDATVEGNILFNFQESMMWSEDVGPGERVFLDTNGMAFGLGTCSVTMTVSCDEGVSSTSSAVALCLGPLFIIP
jgi:hypothetical protein